MEFLKNLSVKLHKPPSKEEFDALPQIGTIERPQLITFQPTEKAFGKNFVLLVRVGPYGSWYRPTPPLLFTETDDEEWPFRARITCNKNRELRCYSKMYMYSKLPASSLTTDPDFFKVENFRLENLEHAPFHLQNCTDVDCWARATRKYIRGVACLNRLSESALTPSGFLTHIRQEMNMSEELFDSVVNELERKHISNSSRKFLKQYKDALAEIAERNEDDNEENLPAANVKVPVVNKRKKRNPNEPTIEENKWIVKVDLNEFENDPTDLSVGIDFSKGLIIPRGKCDQWITRPDGMKIHQSGWAKEISVPDIVEIKPAVKLEGKVLIIECELTQEFLSTTAKLESFYLQNKYPSKEEMLKICSITNMRESRVSTWFRKSFIHPKIVLKLQPQL